MVIMASYLEVPGTMITMLEFHYVRTEFVFDQDLRTQGRIWTRNRGE